MYQPNMLHFVTVMALVQANGGSRKELKDAIYRMYPKMPEEVKGLCRRLIRRKGINMWVDIMVDYYCPEVPPNGNE